jgi:hypothetical protein
MFVWQTEWQPLLRAYLQLERVKEADELVKVTSQTKDWDEEIKQIVVEMAKECGKTSLAKQWEKL